MIPIKVNYRASILDRFEKDTSWFVGFLQQYADRTFSSNQIMLLATDEYRKYIKTVSEYSNEINEEFSHTCAYCNSEVIASYLPIHPIEKNREIPWLASDLYNIYPFCSSCRRLLAIFDYEYKDRFIINEANDLIKKRPNIIIPTQEPTHLFVSVGQNGKIIGHTPEAKRTILNCAVNSSKMIKKRVHAVESLWDDSVSGTDYHMMLKVLKPNRNNINDFKFSKHLENLLEDYDLIDANVNRVFSDKIYRIDQEVSLTDDRSFYPEEYRNLDDPVLVSRVEIEGVRRIDKANIEFNGIKALGVIGENGVGKTSLLEFFCACIRGTKNKPIKTSEDGFVSLGKRFASVSLFGESKGFDFFNNFTSVRLEEGARVHANINKKLRVAYVSESRTGKQIFQKVEEWFFSLDKDRFNVVASQFKEIISAEHKTYFEKDMQENKIYYINGDHRASFQSLSSGFRSIICIVYYIYRQLGSTYVVNEEYSHLDEVVGVVLIDEIELHLHPSWKISIVRKIKDIFPDLLFVFTTHDPLVLKGCEEKEVLLLKRSINGNTSVYQDLPSLEKYGSDIILTSRYFGLSSVKDFEEGERLIDFYKEIASKGDNIASHIKSLRGRGMLGSTYREILAHLFVDISLAQDKPLDTRAALQFINSKVNKLD